MPYAIVASPLGPLGLRWEGSLLIALDLEPGGGWPVTAEPPPAALLEPLRAYFAGAAAVPAVPLAPAPTPFQQRVRAALLAIPWGQTRTYGALARVLGSGARAVGQACRANPCPILVPCHRVVGAAGLGGFAGERGGARLAVKRWLLAHEGWAGLERA